MLAPFIISSTTSGFRSVEVSPKFEKSLLATFLKIRLIIFPDLVLGSPAAKWIKSGVAIGPIFFRTTCFNSSLNFNCLWLPN